MGLDASNELHDAGDTDAGRLDSSVADAGSVDAGRSDAGRSPDPRGCASPEALIEIATSPNGAAGYAIATDGDGNLYVGGRFSDTLTMRGGTMLAATVGVRGDGFLLSLTPDGAVRWARRFADAHDGDQVVARALVVGDLVIATGMFVGELDLHVPGPSGELPPLVETGSSVTTGFVAALRTSDGTPVLAHVYEGALAAAGGSRIVAAGGAHPACAATPDDVQVALLDFASLVTDPATGARLPTCVRAAGFADATITRAAVVGGDVVLLGTSTADRFGTRTITRPAGSTGSRREGLVARLSPELAVRWARGYQVLPHPRHTHPSSLALLHVGEHDDVTVVAGRVLGVADLGAGALVGFSSGSDWDIVLAGLDPATGETLWSEIFDEEGSDELAGIDVDRAGQIHLAGRFFGPTYDVSGGAAPLTGSGEMFAATFGGTGEHHCSLASTGGAGATMPLATATSPGGHEWLVVGSTYGKLEFGGHEIGDPTSSRGRVFVQRFSLDE